MKMIYYLLLQDKFEKEIVKKTIHEFDKKAKIITEDSDENEEESIKKCDLIICDKTRDKINELSKYKKNIIVYIPKGKTPISLLKNKKIYTYKRRNELREILTFLLNRKKTYQLLKMITFIVILVIALLVSILCIRNSIVKSNNKKIEAQEKKEKELQKKELERKKLEEKKKAIKKENIVFLGDSITYQYDLDHFYPEVPHVRSGVNGYCTDDIIDHMEDFVYIYNPTKVVLLIGTNDIRFKDYDNEELVSQIKKIVTLIKKNRKTAKIYVESIYPVNKESDDKKISQSMVGTRDNKRIIEVNKLLKEMCEEEEINYIDVYDELTDESGNLNIDYTIEGLHLSVKGYEVLTERLKKELEIEEQIDK